MNKMSEKTKNLINRIGMSAQALALTAGTGLTAFAGGTNFQTYTVNDQADATTIIGSVIGMILFAFRMVGAVMTIYGVVQVVQTIGENNADQRQKGIISTVAGIFMVALPSILQALNIIS